MNKLFLSIIFAAVSIFSANAQGYKNPVIPGYHPDPSVCRVGDDFYLVTSSFQFFPGVPLYHSKDLVHWEQIGNVLDRPSQLPLAKANCWGGIYAPTIRYNDGTFYMITTNCSSKGNFIVYTDDLSKGWSDPVWLKQGGIDPSLYFEDGHCYMVSNPSDCIWLCEINPKTGEQLTESKRIYQGIGRRYPEAPHIYKKDGFYYLMIAEGGTELAHSETIARSQWIDGPYTPCPHTLLTHCNRIAETNPIQGTGHADLVQAADSSWWMVCLAFRNMSGANHNIGRETYLAPVRWDKGAWPVVNSNGTIALDMDCQTLPSAPFVKNPKAGNLADHGKYNFKSMKSASGFQDVEKVLGPEWVSMRNPKEANYNLKNGLILTTSTDRLSREEDYPTYISIRQENIKFATTTRLTLRNAQKGDEAGISLFMTEGSHYDFYLTKNAEGKTQLQIRYNLISLQHEEPAITLPSDACTLRVSGDAEYYYFSYSTDGKNFKQIGQMNTRYLSSECAGGFTGVTIGLYTQSFNQTTQASALYDNLIYEAQ